MTRVKIKPRQANLIDRALREKLNGQDYSKGEELLVWEFLINPEFKSLVERYNNTGKR